VSFIKNTIPNRITLARLLASPFFVLLFWLGVRSPDPAIHLPSLNPWLVGAALALLVLQEISDMVDGALARRRGVVTDLGKLLDPLADTLSHMGAFICLMWVGLFPLWLLVLMYYREAIVSTLRVVAARQGIVLGARISGKLKAVCQGGAANLLLAFMLITHIVPGFPLSQIADIFSWIVGAVTLLSLVDYCNAVWRTIDRPVPAP